MLFYLHEFYTGKEFIIASLLYILILIITFSVHEFAHAYVAYKSGDPTPKMMGRVTLNPIAHLDPLGLICSVLFFFGWAKPVQINPLNFKNQRKGMLLVSCAGVIANLIIAFVSCGAMCAVAKFGNFSSTFIFVLYLFFDILFIFNIGNAVFNFLPLYPLDGFQFVFALSNPGNKFVAFLLKYSYIIMLVLLLFASGFLTNIIGAIAKPMILFWGLIF